MLIDVLTLFPEIFSGYVGQSLVHKAIQRGLVTIRTHQLRDWTEPPHHKVDDRPFGGGPGMILMAEPVIAAVEEVQQASQPPAEVILLTPQGERLSQPLLEQLAGGPRYLLLCGRYEGFDQRVVDVLQPRELSIGDYVLNGGEVAAMVLIDALVRLIPGVLGDEESHRQDSFSSGQRMLEYPQYTRPRSFRGWDVPEVLLSGNHGEIEKWRQAESQRRTAERRKDLLS